MGFARDAHTLAAKLCGTKQLELESLIKAAQWAITLDGKDDIATKVAFETFKIYQTEFLHRIHENPQ